MSQSGRFHLDWFAGASTQVDLYRPDKDNKYSFRCSPAFRSTIRLSRQECLDPDDFRRLLEQLATLRGAVKNSRGASEAAQTIGEDLLKWYLPKEIQDEFRQKQIFIELGLDQDLVQLPWELMYDGDKYVSLRHDIGRFINTGDTFIPKSTRVEGWFSDQYDKLSILVISVPEPQDRGTVKYRLLSEAQTETEALKRLLGDKAEIDLTVLRDKDAKWRSVRDVVASGRYDIIHYNGHAYSRTDRPGSGLVLYDHDMMSETIIKAFGSRPPILLFMNACETGSLQSGGPEEARGLNVAGLGKAFLMTGAYLIGNMWPVTDRGSEIFARQFYSSLLGELVSKPDGANRSLGQAIREARTQCRRMCGADDLSWASYVLYGDPRLGFRLTAQGQTDEMARVMLDLLQDAIAGSANPARVGGESAKARK